MARVQTPGPTILWTYKYNTHKVHEGFHYTVDGDSANYKSYDYKAAEYSAACTQIDLNIEPRLTRTVEAFITPST
jgi:hypothetical protein